LNEYQQNPYDQYDPDGTPIEDLRARLMQLQGKITSTISNVEELGTEVSEYQSQITQTLEEISLEVFAIDSVTGVKHSRIGDLSVRADSIELSLKEVVEAAEGTSQKISTIELTIDSITSTVADMESTVGGISGEISTIDQKADQIAISVGKVDSRVGDAEASIYAQSEAIQSKVSKTDFTGNAIASVINQSATTITLMASRIDLVGITNVYQALQIGANAYDGNVKSIVFNGEARINSRSAGNLELSAQSLDLSTPAVIYWGSNAPAAKFG
jgi:chromosome segregation ATPase